MCLASGCLLSWLPLPLLFCLRRAAPAAAAAATFPRRRFHRQYCGLLLELACLLTRAASATATQVPRRGAAGRPAPAGAQPAQPAGRQPRKAHRCEGFCWLCALSKGRPAPGRCPSLCLRPLGCHRCDRLPSCGQGCKQESAAASLADHPALFRHHSDSRRARKSCTDACRPCRAILAGHFRMPPCNAWPLLNANPLVPGACMRRRRAPPPAWALPDCS